MILTSIGGLIGVALVVGGIAILAAVAFGRDDDGYFTSDREVLESREFAITTDEVDLGIDAADLAPDEVLGDVRIRIYSHQPIFVGIGADADVERYLAGVAGDELTDFADGDPVYESNPGGPPPGPPGRQNFWVADTEGAGEQTLRWGAGFGKWKAVVMKANGSRGVLVEADAAIKLDWAGWAGLGLMITGLVIGGLAVGLILLIGRRASRDPVASR